MSEQEPIAAFKAYFRGARFDRKGEMTFDLVIPKEEKYNALPMTDIGDLLFHFKVYAQTHEFTTYEALEGFEMPEGSQMGDGTGDHWVQGGFAESKLLDEGLVINQNRKRDDKSGR